MRIGTCAHVAIPSYTAATMLMSAMDIRLVQVIMYTLPGSSAALVVNFTMVMVLDTNAEATLLNLTWVSAVEVVRKGRLVLSVRLGMRP